MKKIGTQPTWVGLCICRCLQESMMFGYARILAPMSCWVETHSCLSKQIRYDDDCFQKKWDKTFTSRQWHAWFWLGRVSSWPRSTIWSRQLYDYFCLLQQGKYLRHKSLLKTLKYSWVSIISQNAPLFSNYMLFVQLYCPFILFSQLYVLNSMVSSHSFTLFWKWRTQVFSEFCPK